MPFNAYIFFFDQTNVCQPLFNNGQIFVCVIITINRYVCV